MAGVAWLSFLLLLQLAALGASAPLEKDTEADAVPGQRSPPVAVLTSPQGSSTLIKPPESNPPQSGAASPDSPPKTGHATTKKSQDLIAESKSLDGPVPNSVQDPELHLSENSQDKPESSLAGGHVPDVSPPKSESKETDNKPPEKSQPHTADSDAQKSDNNETKQGGNLPEKSKSLAPDASAEIVESDPKAGKETEDLPQSTENNKSGAASPPQTSDQNEENQKENVPAKSTPPHSEVSVADSSHQKSDQNEAKQNENLPAESTPPQSAVSGAASPPQTSDQNDADQNENLLPKSTPPQTDTSVADSSPQKSDQNEPNFPAAAENTFDELDDDGIADDDLIGDDKEGEEIPGASQSEKDEMKNSPVGPAPKTESENSHFFAYLVTTAIVVAALYIAYHNKRKIIAFALEGKKSKVIRRPKSSDYQRLDQKI